MIFDMDRGAVTNRPSRIFRPTILLHQTDQPVQNTTEKDGKSPPTSDAWQGLPTHDCILYPRMQLPGGSQFNTSNLAGAGTKFCHPLRCPLPTCPDQIQLRMVNSLMPKALSMTDENGNGVNKRFAGNNQSSSTCSQEILAVRITSSLDVTGGNKSNIEESANTNKLAMKEAREPVRRKRYQCPFCTVACSNIGQLRGHLRCHTGERPFACSVDGCSRKFARNEELTRHKRIHSGVRPFMCDTCQKTFGRKDHLRKHSKTHLTPNEKKSYLCPVCNQGYSRSDALRRHKATAHAQLQTER